MQLKDAVFAIVIIVLWYFSVFYIAAPHAVHNELFGGFGMTHEQHHILGISLFVVSLVVIAFWASTLKDESEKKLPAATPGSNAQKSSP